jgi:tetratricopeptide (TPR) repeat protein
MFAFQHNEYLIVLAAIPLFILLYVLLLTWKKRTIKKIGDPLLVKEMIKNHSASRFALKFVLVVLAFTLGALALANLRSPAGVQQVNRNGIDVMIAIDVSKSMLAQDVRPNRLERAKQALGKLIDRLQNDRIGIVVFAGKAYLQMPLTGDHGAAKMYLASISTDVVPTQGTVISEALDMCHAAFNTKEKKYKAVILVSDGEDHDEGSLAKAGEMAEDGIVINTVGIGSATGSTIIDDLTNQPKVDVNGNTVITKLNEEELMKIAEEGKGAYQLFSNADDMVDKLDAQLASMDQRTIVEDSLINYKNYFPYFLLLALMLLLVEMFISERKRIRLRTNVAKSSALFLVPFVIAIIPGSSSAQDEKKLIKQGNEAYEKKDYEQAVTNYKKASEKDPASGTATYNLGNALYRSRKTDEAVQAYDNAVANAATDLDRSKAFYNKGVVLQNNKKLPECIDAYKNALKLNPADEDARQNLQRALQQQKQQQQKDNKDKKEEKKPKEDKKQKEKPKEEQQPKQQQSKLSKQDAEEKLKALLQQEKNLQEKLRRVNQSSSSKPEKDW